MWTHKPANQSLQAFAEEGVAYVEKKYGYKPLRVEYRQEEGEINIPDVPCIAKSSNVQPGVVLLFITEKENGS